MKKVLIVLLTAAVLVCFAACGEQSTSEPEAKGSDPAASAEQSAAVTETQGAENTGAERAEDTGTDGESYVDYTADIGLLMINSEPCVVGADDCFGTGAVAMICDRTATYSFKSSAEDVKWTVFILDEPFTDAPRFLPQSRTADLDGDGTLKIEADKYVYICCSVNSFTSAAPSDATLTIDIA